MFHSSAAGAAASSSSVSVASLEELYEIAKNYHANDPSKLREALLNDPSLIFYSPANRRWTIAHQLSYNNAQELMAAVGMKWGNKIDWRTKAPDKTTIVDAAGTQAMKRFCNALIHQSENFAKSHSDALAAAVEGKEGEPGNGKDEDEVGLEAASQALFQTFHGVLQRILALDFSTLTDESISNAEQGIMGVMKLIEKEKENRSSCVVCLDKPKTVTLKPCDHKEVCDVCAQLIDVCPYCRENISK